MLSNGEMGALFEWTRMAKVNVLLQPPVPSRCQTGKPKPLLCLCVTKNKELSSDTARLELISTYLKLQGCSAHFSGGGYTLRHKVLHIAVLHSLLAVYF